ncbi:Glycerophosphocholine phosphodiesterase [Mucor velutinosus]|uniref:Glycerophosphocholine phosphodiesterase n=1 Tax=Mucor velutinosus TaxID=708070 RepID=A0AAN7HZQ7_9FUNG|nr:Glycerophosphocholine phosphodiesterase [Mucor velutinosus]
MHGEVVPVRNGTPTNPTTPSTNRKIKTRIWRNARTSDGYFLDISKVATMTEQQHLKIIDQQYKASNFLGIKFLGKNAQRYIEVYPNKDIVERFLTEGVIYETENSKIQLFPCKAVDGEGKLIQITLTDIPFLPQEQLLQELSTAIGAFGKILDIGLNYEQSMGWFMGSGYAIIQQQSNVKYPTLHHSITWQTATQEEEFCHATFPDMATWCRYCHEEGHTKFECPKAMARIICYNCDKAGHRQDTCTKPRKGSSDREFKKARKIPSNTPSVEANKSQWAPSNIKNSNVGKEQTQGQQQQQDQEPKQDLKANAMPPINLSQATQSGDLPDKQGESADEDSTSQVTPMSTDEEDDEDYQPSTSDSEDESDSEAERTTEEMSDVETNGDEIATLMSDQQQTLSPFSMKSVNGDSNTNTQTASPENHNDSTVRHQNFLVKAGHPQTQSSYLRHIRLQQFNIISLQETHATDTTITSIELQLQAQQYLWTYYCGIVSYSSDYILTKIATSHLYESDRYIFCKVHHPHSFYEPFYILNLYAPATSDHRPRQEFFESIYTLLSTLSETIDLERLLISGDFNYDYARDINNASRISRTSLNWLGYLDQHFHNCMILNDMDTVPTYQHAFSTIDYVYAGHALRHLLSDANVGFIPLSWSDHAILEITLKLGKSKLGPGLWRGNPCYANNPTFRKQLEETINATMDTMEVNMTPQDQWEHIKRITKKAIQKFGVKHVNWRRMSIKHLERKRNRLLRSKPPIATLRILLPRIDSMLQILQQELVDIAALKAGDIWREKGEKSAGYLKRLHQKRTSQQYMASIQAPDSCRDLANRGASIMITTEVVNSAVVNGDPYMGVTPRDFGGAGATEDSLVEQDETRLPMDGFGAEPTDNAADTHDGAAQAGNSSPGWRPWISGQIEDMKSFAWQYYADLYKADPVAPEHIEAYLNSITFEKVLTADEQQSLTDNITMDELLQQANRSMKATAPGSDGLAYPFLSLLFSMARLEKLVLQVYNDALNGIFPSSWHDLRIRLLPKKGLLALLKNWRPICLLGCDGKVFTRLLAHRMAPILGRIINPFQSGFLQQRFICDNGMALSMVLEEARAFNHTGAGILLDQEKAYDRVNADYLCAVLLRLGFPASFVSCVRLLFFGNDMYININGYFTPAVKQERGIRQGDPLSPLLFDVALEPFLLSILQDPYFHGFRVSNGTSAEVAPRVSPAIKCLAYADDVCVLLRDELDLYRLQQHMANYAAVSNAKFNEDKSEAFSLSGRRSLAWVRAFEEINVHTYHHQGSTAAFRYLGLYFAYNQGQRAQTEEMLLNSVQTQCAIYSQRQLSIMGRVTIVNSLILSKIWYSLRMLRPTKRFLEKVKSCVYQFVWKKKRPLIRKDLIFLPKSRGGLAVLDPSLQQLILQKRWLNYLVEPQKYPSFLLPLLISHLSLLPGSSDFPYMAFLDAECRKSSLLHKDLSIWHSIFASYDYFEFPDLRQVEVIPLQTIMRLPLHKLLTGLNDDHWLKRHPKFPANKFLLFDSHQQRLRLRVASEYPVYRHLCASLYQEILVLKTVHLVPGVWPHILHPPSHSSLDWTNFDFFGTLGITDKWKLYHPSTYRQQQQQLVPSEHRFTNVMVKALWSSPAHPAARTVLYRALSRCIPHKTYLRTIGSVETPICPFCAQGIDTLRHFIVDCPVKWQLWQTVLSQYYSNFPLTSEIIYGTVRYLHLPHFIKDRSKYIAVISTIFWQMWNLYWLHGSQNPSPLSAASIERFPSRTVCLIDKLLPTNT